ncbi:LOW QUALITY PROTEIN: RING finger protein 215, partial [Syngnathus typhle]
VVGQGATMTLWSSCRLSRGGRYDEWQGIICIGETNSEMQTIICIGETNSEMQTIMLLCTHAPCEHDVLFKSQPFLWDTVLVVLILSTGVILQAHRYNLDRQLVDDHVLQSLPKRDFLKIMSSLRTKTYRQLRRPSVCLKPFNRNQHLRVLLCRHEYHRACVDPWLLHHTCPLCN